MEGQNVNNVSVLQIFDTFGAHSLILNLHILPPWKTAQDTFPLAERTQEGTRSEDWTEREQCIVNWWRSTHNRGLAYSWAPQALWQAILTVVIFFWPERSTWDNWDKKQRVGGTAGHKQVKIHLSVIGSWLEKPLISVLMELVTKDKTSGKVYFQPESCTKKIEIWMGN